MSADDDLWEALDNINTVVKDNKNKCDNCDSINIISDHSKGCKRCLDCGTCFGQIYDEKPEWSIYEDGHNEGTARCSQPTSFFYPKSSMCTAITGKKGSIIRTLQMWDQMIYQEYTLLNVLTFLEYICGKNYLPKSVTENAKILYKQIHDKRIIIRGEKKRYGVYGGCIYHGAKLQGYYRSTDEIATYLNTSPTVITSGTSRVKKILRDNKLLNTIPPTTPLDFIERYCYKLGFTKEQIDVVCRITRNNDRLFLTSNHQPMSVGASCVLLYIKMYDIGISKKTVLDTFNITAVTTDKIYNKIYPFRSVVVDDKATDLVVRKFTESKYITIDPSVQDEMAKNSQQLRDELFELYEDFMCIDKVNKRLQEIEQQIVT